MRPELMDYPGYSAQNTPHLAPAVELEDALLALSRRLPALGIRTNLESSSDLDALIPHIKSAIDEVRLWEYYVFDVQSSVRAVHSSLDNKSIKSWGGVDVHGKSLDQLAQIAKSSPGLIENFRAYSGRFCIKPQPEIAAGFVQAAFPGENGTSQASKWGKVLDVLNVDLYAECNDDVKTAIDGVVGRIRYTRLEEGGPKIGEINEKCVDAECRAIS